MLLHELLAGDHLLAGNRPIDRTDDHVTITRLELLRDTEPVVAIVLIARPHSKEELLDVLLRLVLVDDRLVLVVVSAPLVTCIRERNINRRAEPDVRQALYPFLLQKVCHLTKLGNLLCNLGILHVILTSFRLLAQ